MQEAMLVGGSLFALAVYIAADVVRLVTGGRPAPSTVGIVLARLSLAALIGIGLNATLSWWWVDPAAAIVISLLVAREGREAWRGERVATDKSPEAAGSHERSDGALSTVPMPMVDVRVMRVSVRQRRVNMGMGVGLAFRRAGHVSMLVMLIVQVPV